MTIVEQDPYPRLIAGPDAYEDDTLWLERHLGDTQPKPWLSRRDVDIHSPIPWERLVAGLPCSVAEYEAATAGVARPAGQVYPRLVVGPDDRGETAVWVVEDERTQPVPVLFQFMVSETAWALLTAGVPVGVDSTQNAGGA